MPPDDAKRNEFVRLLTLHQPRLHASVYGVLGDATLTQYVVREINAVMWEKTDQFELGSNFSAWMLANSRF